MLTEIEYEYECEDGGYDEPQVEEQVELPAGFYDKFNKLAVSLTQQQIELFFEGLSMYCGGPIPRACLLSPQLMRLTMNITIIQAVDAAYRIMDGLPEYEIRRHSHITNHMKIVLDIITRCQNLRIHPCFRGGILLAALKYLFGFPVNV